MMTKKEREESARMAAKLAQRNRHVNEQKERHVIKAGANLPSQWGRVVTNEQRLIDNGHFMKSSERASLDFHRESYRKAKKASKGVMWTHVSKDGTVTDKTKK